VPELNEFEKTMKAKMTEFCEVFKDQFNESQIEVLHKVKDMPPDDILLIQGPVSEFWIAKIVIAWHREDAHNHGHHFNADRFGCSQNSCMRPIQRSC
jgi:hypothetical protein